MGCSELIAPSNEGCGSVQNNITGSVTILRDSRACFDQHGNYIGQGHWKAGKLIVERNTDMFVGIRFTVQEYAICVNKSESNVTKHIREGKALPFVIKAEKSPYYNRYILTVSPSIKLKQPLK